MNKSKLYLVTLLLVLLFNIGKCEPIPEMIINPDHNTIITSKMAVDIATQYLYDNSGKEDIEKWKDSIIHINYVQYSDGDRRWIVSIFQNAWANPLNAAISLSPVTGDIIDVHITNIGDFRDVISIWEAENGKQEFWDISLKQLYSLLYRVQTNETSYQEGMITTEDVSSIISEDLNMETLSFSYSLTFHPDWQLSQYCWEAFVYYNDECIYLYYLDAYDGKILDVISQSDGVG